MSATIQSYPNVTDTLDSTAIKNDSLRQFVKDFTKITYPFEFAEPNEEIRIDYKPLNYFFDIEKEELGYENYYYGYVFYGSSYFGLIITRHFTPGAFGINNYFMELITLTYDGEVIDREELGCFCHDTNMGSNDYYATELKITVDSSNIIVKERNVHATLHEEESENSFENITTETYKIDISSEGEISNTRG